MRPKRDHHGTGVKKEMQKFPGIKQYGTGIDPLGSFREFVKRDMITNIDMHRDTVQRKEDLDRRKLCIAIGCTKTIPSPEYMASRPPAVPHESSTDYISFRQGSKPIPIAGATMIQRPQYCKSQTSEQGWVARTSNSTLNNCNSTEYNIISFEANPRTVLRKTTNIDARKQKGITEYTDLMGLHSANFNKEYSAALSSDQNLFKRRTGIFTHMYNAAARHGNITMPFEKPQDLGGKAAFKV